MNISYKWLRQYVACGLTPQETSDALTSIGLETDGLEEIESVRGGLRGLVVGRVASCEPHPDSDHMHVTQVDLGLPSGQTVQIVCGAPNVRQGQTVVVAPVGTTLYDPSDGKPFAIKRSKLRGVESLGMICAQDEVGLGSSHDGIMVLDDKWAPGTPAAEVFGVSSDYVMEVDLTPNRIDAASHYGVARDLDAYLRCRLGARPSLHRPSVEAFAPDRPDGALAVQVDDTQGAPRYSGLTMRGVTVGPSPQWLQERLSAIGLRPINNVVDVTNYILHGFCQPLHCFDADKVRGGRIVVRTCPAGTSFTTLDGVERKLHEADLMICDAQGPMCIAGVFGGRDSGVTEATRDIFLESACFNPTRIRRTARRHGLSTDASFRYERGVDPNGTMYALKLAALMIKELAGGEICGEPVDVYPEPVGPYEVTLDYGRLNALLGADIPPREVDKILAALEIEVQPLEGGRALLRVPTYRMDVRRPCDVAEEVLRIYGYNRVEPGATVHSSLQFKGAVDAADDLRRLLSEQLTAQGFNEIVSNSLTAESYYRPLATYPAERSPRLINPLSADLALMRQTLLFGGLEALSRNINRRSPDLALYEFGNVYSYSGGDASADASAVLKPYAEHQQLALWLTGRRRGANWARQAEEATVYDLKAAVEELLRRMGLPEGRQVAWHTPQEAQADVYGASLELRTRSGKALGRLGLLDTALLRRFDIKQPAAYAQLDFTQLAQLASRQKVTFAPLPKTQDVSRDLALLVDQDVTMADISAAVAGAERKLLRGAPVLFDVYEGANLPAGKKSYAINLTLGDDEHTLADRQIEQAMNRIITALRQKLGAELR